MRPFGTCGFAWLASLLATSCTHGGHPAALAPKDVTVDTVMVFTADSGSTGLFPQISESSRLLPDGPIRPGPKSGPCARGSHSRTLPVGGTAHQTQRPELRLRLADDHAIIGMVFPLAWSEPPMLAEHYLLATGELNPTLRIEVIATGDDSAAQSQFLAALRSIEVPRR